MAWFLKTMCHYSLGNAFVQLVAILTEKKEREFCTSLAVSLSMNLTSLLGTAYCGEQSCCISQ
jgi:hypothetical protein